MNGLGRSWRRLAAISFAVLVIGGCGSGGEAVAPELAATGAWSRPTPAGATAGVVYLTVTSDRPDAIVGVSVAASVADGVELHETTGGGSSGAHQHGAAGGDGTVSMAMVDRFEVEPEAPVVFEPGGNHVMLVGLAEPLASGGSFVLSLELESGRSLEVQVPIQANPPG